MPNETMNPLAAQAAYSEAYRDACARAVRAGRTNFLPVEIGHGTYLMCVLAAEKLGARRALLVVPLHAIETAMAQLERAGCRTVAVGRRKGAMSEACRQASESRPPKTAVYVAAPRQMAEAGHWCEAWTDKTPFDFVAATDAENYTNLKSEQNRGLETVAKRAGTSLLLCDRDHVPHDRMLRIMDAWNTEACELRPARTAPCACEAMGMDAD